MLRHILVGLGFLVLTGLEAKASLQVFPTRLFLNPRNRVSQLTLRHVGNKPETYKITTIFYRQAPTGRLERVETPTTEERSLIQFVRFSPRQVTLPPNVEQTVKIMAMPNEAMLDGEYRAHILFEPIGEVETPDNRVGGKDVAMNLAARVAVAIPVFYRVSPSPEFRAAVKNLRVVTLEDQKTGFEVELEAFGNRFLYADVQVWFKPNGSKAQQVGTVLGLSSYVPKRTIRFPLNGINGIPLENGTLTLNLNETQEEGGKLLATTEIALPQ